MRAKRLLLPLLVLLLLAGAAGAHASTLSAGGVFCLDPIFSDGSTTNTYIANGSDTDFLTVKWTVWTGSSNPPTTRTEKLVGIGFGVNLTEANFPGLFPGWFQACVNNTSGSTIHFSLTQSVTFQ
jgi:hypothetical protein